MSAERIGSGVQENTSGQGKGTELPDELKGLNWGAFFFNWVWGLFNSTYIALLVLGLPLGGMVSGFVLLILGFDKLGNALIAVFFAGGLAMVFVLLFKGNKWAWANKSWDDHDHFRRVQRKWGWAALIFVLLTPPAVAGGFMTVFSLMKNSEPYKMGHEMMRQHPEAVKILGKPIEGSWWMTGNIDLSGSSGTADFAHSVSGPNDEGTLYITAVMKDGQWRLTKLFLNTEKAQKRLNLLAGPDQPQIDKAFDLHKEGNYAAALAIFMSLADKGHPIALKNLGAMHENGQGVPKNQDEAAKWYLRSAEKGFHEAQFIMGIRYENGIGVSRDDKEAIKWYLLAAAQDHAKAMNNVGVMYGDGRGAAKDIVTAYMWFSLAHQRGFTPAKRGLNHYARQMTPEQIAQAEGMAKAWTPENMSPVKTMAPKAEAKPAAEPAAKPAMKEKEKPGLVTVRELKMLAAKGDTDAQVRLGDLHLTGNGVFKNGSLAATWYQRAAEKGNAMGQYRIALMYLDGVYLPMDPKEARKWLKKAAQQGHAGARKTLKTRLGETPPPVIKSKPDKK